MKLSELEGALALDIYDTFLRLEDSIATLYG
jgi:hypothetical protein